MNQYTAVNKAIKSLQECIDINESQISFIKHHLNMVYAVGFDTGRNHTETTRMVYQYKEGVLIEAYKSVSEAARVVNVHRTSIEGAIHRNGLCAGFTWIYV